jgi:predicted deacylase
MNAPKPDFELAGLRAAPGTRARGYVDLAEGPAGTLVRAAVILLNGAAPGPSLLVASGVHGDDLNTVPMVWRLAQQVDPAVLRGQLVLVPVANPVAFEAGTHLTPADNAAPSYPGDPAGTLSQRMGHGLWAQVAARMDYVIDMHGGSKNATLAVLAAVDGDAAPEVAQAARRMAEAFQPELVVVHHARPGKPAAGLMEAASQRGAPGVYLGLGRMGFVEADTARGAAGVQAILRALGMLPAAGVAPAAPPPYTLAELYQSSPVGGAFEPAVEAGAVVAVGDLLGRVRDVFGQPKGEVRAQAAGIVDAIRNYPVVSAGEWVASIARWQEADESGTAD